MTNNLSNDYYNNMVLGGMTMAEWDAEEQEQSQYYLDDGISYEDAVNLGMLEAPQAEPQQEENNETREFQKLSVGDTLKDVGTSVAKEAGKVFVPKKDGLANKALSKVGLGGFNEENLGLDYQAKTRVGETFKYLYRYGAGTLATVYSGGLVGGAMAASKVGTVAKMGIGLKKLLTSDKLFKTSKGGLKAAGVWLGNNALSGAVGGAVTDFMVYRPEEGHMADMFGNADWARPFQTQEDDTEFEGRIKNVVEGLVMGGVIGTTVAPIMRRVCSKWVKANKTALTTESETEAAKALQEAAEASQQIKQVTNTSDVYNTVKEFKAKADMDGVDASELIQNNIPSEYQSTAKDMLEIMNKGDDIFIHEDGTFDIKVSTWEDASKVSKEEYDRQLRNADEVKAKDLNDVRYGDTALGHMDAATKSTWENRGWLGEGDSSLVKVKTDKEGFETKTVNKTVANKIAKNYSDKWEIDNNIKVEVVDGLKDSNGNPVSGRTEGTKYQGKTTTNKQNAIDKQKLKISKLEDKITQEEGSNAPVADVLDNLKEELRIAKNELKELEKANKKQNRIPNITIKIDANCENPHAVLRSELEHARDIAKGTVPDQNVKHFSRYDGMNESEVASGYVHKKSTSRSLQNDMNTLNDKENMLSSKVEDSNVSETNTRRTTEDERSLQQDDGRSSSSDGRGVDSEVHEEVRMDKSRLGNTSLARELVETRVDKTYNLLKNTPEASNKFVEALNLAKESREAFGKQVHTYTAEEYNNMKLYLSNDGKMGFAIKPDGDLVSVFIHKEKGGKGLSHKLIELAKQQGATKLDCYDTYLTDLYKEHGFVEVGRDKWNDKYAPEGWNKSKLGEPDVVYMELSEKQLKLDFNSVDEVADAVGKGDFKYQTAADVDRLAMESADKFTPYAKTTWKEICEAVDNDPVLKQIVEGLDAEDVLRYSGNPEQLAALVKRELGTLKLQDALTQRLMTTTDKAAKREIMNLMTKLQDRIEAYRSYSGLTLNVQKASHIIEDAYANKTLTEFDRNGITALSDIIENALKKIDLNFTKGELVNKKQEIIASILADADVNFLKLIKDEDLQQAFNESIDKVLKDKRFDKDVFVKDIRNAILDKQISYVEKLSKEAPTLEGQRKTLLNWQNAQSFYVHNLLSGVGTICKNVLSGAVNTLYFPVKKMLAGAVFGGGDAMYKEGLGTLNAMLSNWNDAYLLARQAFINGEGVMTNLSKDTMSETQQAAFNKWGKEDASILEHLQNLHSFMTRLMGATDEFMSQFNYRSIVKSKAYLQAEELAKTVNKQNDQQWIEEQANKFFNASFDGSGRPLDIDAYYESKSALYQTPLDGKAFDGTQMREQTWAMAAGESINNAVAGKAPALKFLFPFVKTGVNILQMNLDHNVFYALCSKSQRELLFSQTAEGALARSQVAFGAFSLTMAGAIALSGGITGSLPRDPKEKRALLATGWRPYSIVTPDGKYISYQGYEPLHTILGFAADIVELGTSIATDEDYMSMEKVINEGWGIILNNFLDKAAFRSGVSALNIIFDTDGSTLENLEKLGANTAAGFLPDASFVKGVSTLGERDAKSPKTFMDRWLNMYFNRGLGEQRRNCFGEKQNVTNLIMSNGASLEHTPENDELLRLAEYGFKPSEITDVIAKTNYNYKDFKDDKGRNAYDYMMEALSESGLREAVRDLVTSPEYQELPDGILTDDAKANGVKFTSADETKINALKALFIEYNNKAKEDVMFDHPELMNKEGVSLGDAQQESLSNKLNLLINQGLNNDLNELNNFY